MPFEIRPVEKQLTISFFLIFEFVLLKIIAILVGKLLWFDLQAS